MENFFEELVRLQDPEVILNSVVEEAVCLTGSEVGYFAVLNRRDDVVTMLAWSARARQCCAMLERPMVYPIEQTGIWGDCVRERQAVVTNDYDACTRPTKKGYPEQHVPIRSHMNVPVWEGERVAAILGVGNRLTPYTEVEVQTLQEYANRAWLLLKPYAEARARNWGY